MAVETHLRAVTSAQLEQLRQDPSSLGWLDTGLSAAEHLDTSVTYFLTGSSYPAVDDHPLAPVLQGTTDVQCPGLENGSFAVVPPDVVVALAGHLAGVDLAGLRAAVAAADLDGLVDDEELYDLEVFEADEVPDEVVATVERLTAFYRRAAADGLGVVIYQT